MATINRFFPKLTSIFSLDDLPSNGVFDFLKAKITTILNDLYVKDLQVSRASDGTSAFYSLSIVTDKVVDFEIPGTGVFLVLNKGNVVDNFSTFPITVSYTWKILGLIEEFTGSFPPSMEDAASILNQVLNVSDKSIINNSYLRFADLNSANLPQNQFIDAINNYYTTQSAPITTPLSYPSATSNEVAELMMQEINAKLPDSVLMCVFRVFLLDSNSLDNTWKNVKQFFKGFTRQDLRNILKELLVPQIKATFLFKGGIEVPRRWLIPLDSSNEPIPETAPNSGMPRALFDVVDSTIILDTQEELNLALNFELSTSTKMKIANTNLIIDFKKLKLDLRKDRNLPEVASDGRPDDFIGVCIEKCTLNFPNSWQATGGTNTEVTGRNIIIGDQGGLSGKFSIDTANTEFLVPFLVSSINQLSYNSVTEEVVVTSDSLAGQTEQKVFKHTNVPCSHIFTKLNKKVKKDYLPLTKYNKWKYGSNLALLS